MNLAEQRKLTDFFQNFQLQKSQDKLYPIFEVRKPFTNDFNYNYILNMNLSRLLLLLFFVCFVLSNQENQDNDDDNFSDFDDHPDSEVEDNVDDNNYNSTDPEPEFFYKKETYKS